MDVSGLINDYQRDLDNLKSQLREREQDHVDEIEEQRRKTAQREDALEAEHAGTVRRTKERYDEDLTSATSEARRNSRDQSDRYERELKQTRDENYDRHGRLARDISTEAAQDKAFRKKQVEDYLSSTRVVDDSEVLQLKKQIELARESKLADQRKMQDYYEHKLDEQKRLQYDQLLRSSKDTREKIDGNINEMHGELTREKIGDQMRFRKYVEEQKLENDTREKNTLLRESHLRQKAEDAASGKGSGAQRTLAEYTARANDTIERMGHEHNLAQALKDQQHAENIHGVEHDLYSRGADREAIHKKAEDTLAARLAAEQASNENNQTRLNRKYRQDLNQSQEDLMRAGRESSNRTRQDYHDALAAHRNRAESTLQKTHDDLSSKLRDDQRHASGKLTTERRKSARDLADTEERAKRMQRRLTENYQRSQEAFDEQKARQLDAQKAFYASKMRKVEDDTSHRLRGASRENQYNLYKANDDLRRQTTELAAMYGAQLGEHEQNLKTRADRLARTYGESLASQRDHFDETISEAAHDNRMKVAKLNSEREHSSRMQLMDLQAKNREIMDGYENRIQQLREEHTAELARSKAETDKTVRDAMKKAKETMDRDRSLLQSQLDIKDRQMEEKLKLQAESFRDQIEKLKRTNELAIKKS
ncbi:MAG: hypothetical protein HYW49_12575 [Deltaproteobacteria bacterium]|nr:hypothetical protein [Deltaproteobacteria bacterium]